MLITNTFNKIIKAIESTAYKYLNRHKICILCKIAKVIKDFEQGDSN